MLCKLDIYFVARWQKYFALCNARFAHAAANNSKICYFLIVNKARRAEMPMKSAQMPAFRNHYTMESGGERLPGAGTDVPIGTPLRPLVDQTPIGARLQLEAVALIFSLNFRTRFLF